MSSLENNNKIEEGSIHPSALDKEANKLVKLTEIVEITNSDSSSESSSNAPVVTKPKLVIETKRPKERMRFRGSGPVSTLEITPDMRFGSRKRQSRLRGSVLLSDQMMEEELHFCIRQLQCCEDQAGIVKREGIIQQLDMMVKVWSKEEAGEEVGGRVVSYGSYKLEVIDAQSDLDLLCVVPRQVSRESFFGRFYNSLKAKVGKYYDHLSTGKCLFLVWFIFFGRNIYKRF